MGRFDFIDWLDHLNALRKSVRRVCPEGQRCRFQRRSLKYLSCNPVMQHRSDLILWTGWITGKPSGNWFDRFDRKVKDTNLSAEAAFSG